MNLNMFHKAGGIGLSRTGNLSHGNLESVYFLKKTRDYFVVVAYPCIVDVMPYFPDHKTLQSIRT